MDKYKRMLFVVAHPDDAEICAGGTILKLSKKGYDIKVLVMTNGSLNTISKIRILSSKKRKLEQKNAAIYGNFSYEILAIPDGELTPSLKNRKKLINKIKLFQPHVIFTHRKNDYHPDHRYTSQLVEDSLVLMCMEKYCPKYNKLDYNPILLYFWDRFQKPIMFVPDIVVNIEKFYSQKIKLTYQHTSQFSSYIACKQVLDDNNALQLKQKLNATSKYIETFEIGEYALLNEINNFKNNIKQIFGDKI